MLINYFTPFLLLFDKIRIYCIIKVDSIEDDNFKIGA